MYFVFILILISFLSAENSRVPLTSWTLADYNQNTLDFPVSVLPANKKLMYNSTLPFNSNIYTADGSYRLPILTTVWGTVDTPKMNVGVGGSFPYTEDWYKWGGDDMMEFGKSRYSSILADFGHSHILSIHIRNAILMTNKDGDITDIDLSLQRLAGASSFIFGWFGAIIDNDGNFKNYLVDDAAYTTVVQIKNLTKQFIFGTGAAYGQPGSFLNLNEIDGFMTYMLNCYGTSTAHKAKLTAIKNALGYTLFTQLRMGTSNPIPLVAWDPLMKHHQMHTSRGYEVYRDYYAQPNNNAAEREAAANKMYRDGIDMGRQMGAFFAAFYGFTDFMDKLLNTEYHNTVPYAIPEMYHTVRTQRVYDDQRRYWVEHTTMFEDYNKACALGDRREMYNVRFTMLESCANIATTIGEIFRAYDNLVRHRDMYTILKTFTSCL